MKWEWAETRFKTKQAKLEESLNLKLSMSSLKISRETEEEVENDRNAATLLLDLPPRPISTSLLHFFILLRSHTHFSSGSTPGQCIVMYNNWRGAILLGKSARLCLRVSSGRQSPHIHRTAARLRLPAEQAESADRFHFLGAAGGHIVRK